MRIIIIFALLVLNWNRKEEGSHRASQTYSWKVPKHSPREIQRETPREPRELTREHPRELSREFPRESPREPPRDSHRDLQRAFLRACRAFASFTWAPAPDTRRRSVDIWRNAIKMNEIFKIWISWGFNLSGIVNIRQGLSSFSHRLFLVQLDVATCSSEGGILTYTKCY